MKKMLLFLVLLGMMAALTACGSSGETAPVADSSTQSTPDPASQAQQMPSESKLLIGTLMLEDTDLAVTPDQASQLLLLWKGVKSLSASDNVTQAEMDALYGQIEESMTTEQMAAINSMTFDMQTLRDLMEKLGITVGPNGSAGVGDGEMPFAFPEGEMPPGDFQMPEGGERPPFSEGGGRGFVEGGAPGGGGMAPGGGMGGQGTQLTEEQRATLQADRSTTGMRRGFGMTSMLVDPLIKLLEERAGK